MPVLGRTSSSDISTHPYYHIQQIAIKHLYGPDTVFGALHALAHLIFATNLHRMFYNYPHCAVEETELQGT